MTSDVGDYRIDGSVTGPDGAGNVGRPFLQQLGPDRHRPETLAERPRSRNTARPCVRKPHRRQRSPSTSIAAPAARSSFRGESRPQLSEPLVQNLPNGAAHAGAGHARATATCASRACMSSSRRRRSEEIKALERLLRQSTPKRSPHRRGGGDGGVCSPNDFTCPERENNAF